MTASVEPGQATAGAVIGETARPSGPGGRRVLQLDILRGAAILLVLGRHGIHDVGDLGLLAPLVAAWSRFGWTGVDLFFVPSGFLIGGLIFAEIKSRNSLDVKRFYVRRAFKILPMYYVYLVIAAVLLKIKVGGSPSYYGRWPGALARCAVGLPQRSARVDVRGRRRDLQRIDRDQGPQGAGPPLPPQERGRVAEVASAYERSRLG